jgi:radical SAM protein with 4Fe4S-binding SPASM domain
MRMPSRIRKLLDILRRPRVVLNYLGIKLAGLRKSDTVAFLPVYIDIEPNNTCNYSCPHCQVPYLKKDRHILDVDGLSYMLDQFPNLRRVKLQGMGEPFLNKNLVQLLREGEARRIEMSIITNGSIFSEEIAEQLSQLRRTLITFSLDGASADVFEGIRVGGSFQRVIDNIRSFARIRGGKPQPALAAWAVVTRSNIRELSDIAKLAKEAGLDHLTIQTYLSDWGKEAMRRRIDPLKLELDSRILRESISAAIETAREIHLPIKIAEHDYYSPESQCPWPWTSAYIAANGDVVPCCIIADSGICCMGNIFSEDFRTIWNGDAYRDLRRRIRSNDLPEYCRGCYRSA